MKTTLFGGHGDGQTIQDGATKVVLPHPMPGQPPTIYRHSPEWSARLRKRILAAEGVQPPLDPYLA